LAVDETDDNVNTVFANVIGAKILAFGCRNNVASAPATVAEISIETMAGAQIGSASATCAGSGSALTWVDVSSDTDGLIPANEAVLFDVTNIPSPATQAHTLCIAFMAAPNVN
jgi:ribulose 1,5-bisphosphate carboxylase large subunit-like protein